MLNVSRESCRAVGDLPGAAPTKVAALVTSLPLVVAALLVIGTFGLALASGPWDAGAAATGCDIAWRNSSVRNRAPLKCFAGNFCPAAFMLL